MRTSRTFQRLTAIGAVAFAAPVATAVTHGQAPSLTRTIYATVRQSDGKPVLDMRADEFEVREGGRAQEFSARSATNPLRVALIVSDRGGGQFQQGALTFC